MIRTEKLRLHKPSPTKSLRREYDRLLSWADLYENSTFEAKKMIVSQFIKAVRVGKDYTIEVDFNVTFEKFQSYCSVKSERTEPCNQVVHYALSCTA